MVTSLRLNELERIKPFLTTPGKLAPRPYRPNEAIQATPKVKLENTFVASQEAILPIVEKVQQVLFQKPERNHFNKDNFPPHLYHLMSAHKALLTNLVNDRIITVSELNYVIHGYKLGDDSAMIQFVGYDVYIHRNSIELKLFDGIWYQSMAIRLPHTANQVLVRIKKYVHERNWHLEISNKSGHYIPY
jgi:hypothetical protein